MSDYIPFSAPELNPHHDYIPTVSVAALQLNPRPNGQVHHCPECRSQLLPPVQCLNGSILTNWSRWFQKWRASLTTFRCVSQSRHLLTRQGPCFSVQKQTAPLLKRSGAVRTENASAFCLVVQAVVRKWEVAMLIESLIVMRFPPTHSTLGSAASNSASTGPLPQSQIAGSSALVLPSNSIPEHNNFARPLSETYSLGFFSRHLNILDANSRLEETQKLNNLRENSANQPARKLTVVNKVPGQFAVTDHKILSSAVVNGFISYLECPLSRSWAGRDARVPIATVRNSHILLRKINIVLDKDCLGLDNEITRLLIERSDESLMNKTRQLLSLSGSGYNQAASLSSSSSSSLSVVAAGERQISPLRFPLTWTCDMEDRFTRMIAARVDKSPEALEAAFNETFTECLFTAGTVYKHLRIYKDAGKFKLLDKYSRVGQNPGGKWSELAKAVQAQRATPGQIIEISDSDDDVKSHDEMTPTGNDGINEQDTQTNDIPYSQKRRNDKCKTQSFKHSTL
ncbi:hypothetical protein C8R45DRAFT_927412 [Mycena sanguinolenta]|nr:hypothetical protein C8R45DRAFT_927412 [Mycena sanguinolenta]